MLVKGIILEQQDNRYLVRIPTFETAGSNQPFTLLATSAYTPGNDQAYIPGDVVFIGFELENIDKPVIIGKLYLGIEDKAQTAGNFYSLKVENTASLSANTQIGDLTYNDLLNIQTLTNQNSTILQDVLAGKYTKNYNTSLQWGQRNDIAKIGDITLSVRMPDDPGGSVGSFVDLSSDQTITGYKTFTNGLAVNQDLRLTGNLSDGSNTIAVSGIENNGNKVTTLSQASTDNQYPSAKCVYTAFNNVDQALQNKQDMITLGPSMQWSENNKLDTKFIVSDVIIDY